MNPIASWLESPDKSRSSPIFSQVKSRLASQVNALVVALLAGIIGANSPLAIIILTDEIWPFRPGSQKEDRTDGQTHWQRNSPVRG